MHSCSQASAYACPFFVRFICLLGVLNVPRVDTAAEAAHSAGHSNGGAGILQLATSGSMWRTQRRNHHFGSVFTTAFNSTGVCARVVVATKGSVLVGNDHAQRGSRGGCGDTQAVLCFCWLLLLLLLLLLLTLCCSAPASCRRCAPWSCCKGHLLATGSNDKTARVINWTYDVTDLDTAGGSPVRRSVDNRLGA